MKMGLFYFLFVKHALILKIHLKMMLNNEQIQQSLEWCVEQVVHVLQSNFIIVKYFN